MSFERVDTITVIEIFKKSQIVQNPEFGFGWYLEKISLFIGISWEHK